MDHKVNFLHICDSAFFAEDKKLSIIGIFERVGTEGFPTAIPKFSIVVNISGDLSRVVRTLEILAPSGDSLAKVKGSPKPLGVGEQKSTNWVINLAGTVFPTAGIYKILVKIDDAIINQDRKDELVVVKQI